MRLTRFSDIGLRVLIYLERASATRSPVTVSEIAAQFDVPVNHLVKVAGHLTRVGWVSATRGRNGGLRLAADPALLRIGTVLRELEGKSELVDCVATGCRLAGDCTVREALKVGLHAFYEAMDRHTLRQMTQGATGENIIRMHRSFSGQASATI